MTNGTPLVYRCDAGHAIGMGHVARGLALADVVRSRHGRDVVFAGRFERAARERIVNAGFAFEPLSSADEAAELGRLVRTLERPVLLCDVRSTLRADDLFALKPFVSGVVVMDDAGERRLAADLAILPPTPTARALDWPGFHGRLEIGWEWVILGRPPLTEPVPAAPSVPPWRLLVTMGGADPNGLTLKAAAALEPFANELAPIFVLGPAFNHRTAQADTIRAALPDAEVIWQTDDLRPLMARCDAALTSYGVTAQELAASGVPSVCLCLSDDHAQSAAALAETGACVSLGRYDLVSNERLASGVMELLRAPARRAEMAAVAAAVIDGRGAERIADEIARFATFKVAGA